MDEEKIPEMVKDWIDRNTEEFGIEPNLHYRKEHLERCKKYLEAPDEYLEQKLKLLSEDRKWYFQIFQAILITAILGMILILTKMSLDAFLDLPRIGFEMKNIAWQLWFKKWALPLIPIGLMYFIRASIIAWVTKTTFVLQNLREIEIELFYIVKIREVRAQNTSTK